MLKKLVVIGGIAAVAGLGLGGVALAESNSTVPAPAVAAVSPTNAANINRVVDAPAAVTTSTAKPGVKTKKSGQRHSLASRLEKVAHAQWVTKDGKTNTFVTHDAVRGAVAAVSGTSITIKAVDGTSETYVVNASTKVHIKGDKGSAKTPGAISKVKVGDQVRVLGTGAASLTATQVVDRGAPKTKAPATS